MEKTKFYEALTSFNNEVSKAAEEVRKQMKEIGLEQVGCYTVVKVKHRGYAKEYLAVKDESDRYFKQHRSLEEGQSTYLLYDTDVWIEAATLDEKIAFMQGMRDVLDELEVKRSEIIGRMSDAVADASRALKPIQELPGFEGTMEAVDGLVEAARKAAGIEEKGGELC